MISLNCQHGNKFVSKFSNILMKTYYLGVRRSRNFVLTSKVRSAALVSGNLIFIFKTNKGKTHQNCKYLAYFHVRELKP